MDGAYRPLRLLPDAEVEHDGARWALRRRGTVHHPKDPMQSAIIQLLDRGYDSLDELEAAVRGSSADMLRDDEVSLVVAGFILDFGEFLEE